MLPGIKCFLETQVSLWGALLQMQAGILTPLYQESSTNLQRVRFLGTTNKLALS